MSGAMVEQLLVQQNTASANTHGSLTPAVWSTVDSVAAERIPLSGAEQLEAGRVGSSVQYRFRIRARADITAAMRALWTPAWPPSATTQVVEIHAVVPDPKDRGFCLLECGTHDGVTT